MGRLVLLAAVALVAVGCHDGGSAAPAERTTSYSVELKPAQIDWDAPLPADVCFVATARYEVDITTRSAVRPDLCDRLARTYLPHEPRLRWPPPYLRDPDAAASVVCVLARRAERLEIDYGPADSGRIDAEAICGRLRAAGWKRRPPWEGLDGPWPSD